LYWKDGRDLFEWEASREFEEVATTLIDHGYKDAAKEVLNLKYTIEQAIVRADVLFERLKGVIQAAEKVEDGNWNKDALVKAVNEYRGEK
jgi:hypothetical protein